MTDDVSRRGGGPAERFRANPDQAEYWNAAAGQKWVAHQETMDAHLLDLAENLLARCEIGTGERVLDVGCGTGATTTMLAERVGPSGHVLGLDISETMLARARERCSGFAHVELAQGDAQVHSLAAASFDHVFSRFGVMFFSDPTAAFANLSGALRPGGRVGFVCWAGLEGNPWFRLPLEVAGRYVGAPEPAPPRSPGPLAFAEPAYVREILSGAGLAAVEVETVETEMTSREAPDLAARFLLTMGPAARLLVAASPPQSTIDALTTDLADALVPYHGVEGVSLPATVHYVRARTPES